MKQLPPQTYSATAEKKKHEITTALNHFYANPVAKASFELFLTIGLVLFLGAFAIRPTLLTMSDLIKEIEEKTALNEALTRKVASLQTAQSQYLIATERLPLLDVAIPSQPQVITSTKIIEKTATDSQVVIRGLTVSEIPEDVNPIITFDQKSKKVVNITANVTGDYRSIRQFVENLRNSRKSFVIESVVFSLEEDRGNRKLQANITIATPYFGVAE